MMMKTPVSVLRSSLNDDTITITYRWVRGHGGNIQLWTGEGVAVTAFYIFTKKYIRQWRTLQ